MAPVVEAENISDVAAVGGKRGAAQAAAGGRRALGDIGNLVAPLARVNVSQAEKARAQELLQQRGVVTRRAAAAAGLKVEDQTQLLAAAAAAKPRRRSSSAAAAAAAAAAAHAAEEEENAATTSNADASAAPAAGGRSMSALLAARSSEALANSNVLLNSSRCGLAAALGHRGVDAKPRNARRVRAPLPALDAADALDPLCAHDYAGDIFAYYARAEPRFRPPCDYMSRQVDVNEKMRAILLDWLVEVHLKFKLLPETLHLTGSLIDRYLATNPVSRKNLQLVGVTAMLVASKYEEIWAPEVRDFVYISDRAYTRDQILACEKALLNALGFQLTVPTAHAFAGRFMKLAAFDDAAGAEAGVAASSPHVSSRTAPSRQMRHYVSYLVELALPEYSMLAHSPSELAAGAVVAARRALGASPEYPRSLERASGVARASAEAAASALSVLAQAAPAVSLQAVYKKYCGPKFGEVARLVQPPAPTVL